MKLYKLTNGLGQTRNETQWGENVTHSGTGEGPLCGPGYIHAYEHPLLAALLFPLHVTWKELRLWEAEGEVVLRDGQLKCGCRVLITLREIPMPEISLAQRVKFARLCAEAAAWTAAEAAEAEAAERAEAEWAAAATAARVAAWAAATARAARMAVGELDLIKLAEEAMKP